MDNKISIYLLIIMLAAASYFDIKERRIPNLLTLPIMVIGLVICTIISGFKGFQFSLFGILFGMAVFFIPFAVGAMGAGDVKLMAAVGALMGWRFTMYAVLYTAVSGGIIVLVIAVCRKRLLVILNGMIGFILAPVFGKLAEKSGNKKVEQFSYWLHEQQLDQKREYIPYGVAITAGALIELIRIAVSP